MKISAFSKSYGSRVVLRFPDLELPDGCIIAVIGPNGSGKSTLARVLAGLERSDQKRPPLVPLRVGYMPQKSYAFRMSVARNIALNGSDSKRRETLLRTLQIDTLAGQSAKRLSGGETARMALARLLMRDYELLRRNTALGLLPWHRRGHPAGNTQPAAGPTHCTACALSPSGRAPGTG